MRNPNPSARALVALHQFNTLGKIELSEPEAKRVYREFCELTPHHNRTNCACDDLLGAPPATDKPIVQAEPIVALVAEIGQRDKDKFK